MPIRLSGMVSGMDTDTLVTALVSGYQTKKDNLVKAQTKLSWKQEKWKTMNTSIYSFYSGKLSAARMSSAYSLKKSTVSNSSVATVTASSSAVSGTQKLVVNQLASSGYLTGGTISSSDGSKVTGSSKLSDIKDCTAQGSITVSVNGKSSNIDLTEDMTVNQFVAKLKDAGVQSSFDENNQRFFISSKTSGEAGDFSITVNDSDGRNSLKSLGLLAKPAKDSKEAKEYERLAGLQEGNADYNAELESMYTKVTADEVAKSYADKYNEAKKALLLLTEDDTSVWTSAEDMQNKINELDDKLNNVNSSANKYVAYLKKDDEGNVVKDSDGNPVYDTNKMKEDDEALYNEYISDNKNLTSYKAMLSDYNKYTDIVSKTADYVTIDDATGEAVADASNEKVLAEVTSTNETAKNDAEVRLKSKIEAASSYASDGYSSDAVKIDGKDAKIKLNGAEFTSNTSTFSINGLTIQATEVTGDDNPVTITTDTDVDAIYKSIKDMFTEYNKLIKSMDEAYNADSSKGYEPLTDDEKDAMSDTEVEKWETKIKDSLLRKDSTLSGVINTLKNDMASSFTINGKSYSLASFGIATLGYFTAGENEKGVYHIDGDKDDTSTSGNDDKLRAAIASDPETVVSFFSQLCTKVYTDLGNKMAASSVSSIYTVYNDKQMNTQYSEYNTKISEAADKVTTWEDYYYSKFSAMESALAKLNSQSSSLSGLFGS